MRPEELRAQLDAVQPQLLVAGVPEASGWPLVWAALGYVLFVAGVIAVIWGMR